MSTSRTVKEIAVRDLIITDADNARQKPVGVEDLMKSIEQHGLLNPITVSETDEKKYRVVAGFNRAHAVTNLGLEKVLVTVDTTEDATQILLLQISENLDRTEFTAFEMALALQRLVDAGMSRAEIASRVGRSQAWCSNHLGFHDLPPEIQARVRAEPEKFTVTQIRFLHAMQKHMEPKELVKMSSNINEFSQNELNGLREKILAKKKGITLPEAEGAEETEVVEVEAAAEEVEEVEDTTEDDAPGPLEQQFNGPKVTRPGFLVMRAIDELARMGEKTTDKCAVAKLQGAIEALQWCLGDDSHPLFQDIEAEIA